MAVDVPLVRYFAEHIEGSQDHPCREEGLDGRGAAQAPSLRPARESELEAARDQRPVFDRLPEQEFVLDRQIAKPARGRPVPRIGEHQRYLYLELPPGPQRELEGPGHLGLPSVAPLLVAYAELQFALNDRATGDNGVEELDVRLLVLRPGGQGRQAQQSDDQ